VGRFARGAAAHRRAYTQDQARGDDRPGRPPDGDSGPTPVSALRTGQTVAVRFANLAKGFAVYESNRPIGFQVCDKAKHCRFVDATRNKDEITLDVSHIRDAATVRYCWADSPICNVYNSEGLPTVPFELPIVAPTRLRK
jgi:sialate O-acetylesterase